MYSSVRAAVATPRALRRSQRGAREETWFPHGSSRRRATFTLSCRRGGPTLAIRDSYPKAGKDLHLAGDPFLVAALEAARRHSRRHAVAEVLGAAKAEGSRPAVLRGIDGSEQQRPTLEVIGGVESHLRVDVAPIRWDRSKAQLPLRAQRRLSGQLRRRGLLDPLQLQRSCDALVIEALSRRRSPGGDAWSARLRGGSPCRVVRGSGDRLRYSRGTRLVFHR